MGSKRLSQKERLSWRSQFQNLSRFKLQDLEIELRSAIEFKAIEAEIEIARRHWDQTLVDRVIRNEGNCRKLQTIFCSIERCNNCPHGPHWYIFSRGKGGKTRVIYDSTAPSTDDADLVSM